MLDRLFDQVLVDQIDNRSNTIAKAVERRWRRSDVADHGLQNQIIFFGILGPL